jgi:5'-3' exonuclease
MGVFALWSFLRSSSTVVRSLSSALSVVSESKVNNQRELKERTKDEENIQTSQGASISSLSKSSSSSLTTSLLGESISLLTYFSQRLAIDLSVWLMELQSLTTQNNQSTQLAMRLLMIRTVNLLSCGILPIFVSDGVSPSLKQRFSECSKGDSIDGRTNRKNPAKIKNYKIAKKLIRLMNLPLIELVHGEAEACCAQLNSLGLVHGIVTTDCDAFLFGGLTVLTQVKLNANKTQATRYQVSTFMKQMNFGREKSIGAALLLGSDYSTGVRGIGPEKAEKLWRTVEEKNFLNRLELIVQGNLKPMEWATRPPALPSSLDPSRVISIDGQLFVRSNYDLLDSIQAEKQFDEFGMKLPQTNTLKSLQEKLREVEEKMIEEDPQVAKTLLKSIESYYSTQEKAQFIKLQQLNAKSLELIRSDYSSRLHEFYEIINSYKNPVLEPSVKNLQVNEQFLPAPDFMGLEQFAQEIGMSQGTIEVIIVKLHCLLALLRRVKQRNKIQEKGEKCPNTNSLPASCSTCLHSGHSHLDCPVKVSDPFSFSCSSVCSLCFVSSCDHSCPLFNDFLDCAFKPKRIDKIRNNNGESFVTLVWEQNPSAVNWLNLYPALKRDHKLINQELDGDEASEAVQSNHEEFSFDYPSLLVEKSEIQVWKDFQQEKLKKETEKNNKLQRGKEKRKD